jgi:hypothetical protein
VRRQAAVREARRSGDRWGARGTARKDDWVARYAAVVPDAGSEWIREDPDTFILGAGRRAFKATPPRGKRSR